MLATDSWWNRVDERPTVHLASDSFFQMISQNDQPLDPGAYGLEKVAVARIHQDRLVAVTDKIGVTAKGGRLLDAEPVDTVSAVLGCKERHGFTAVDRQVAHG